MSQNAAASLTQDTDAQTALRNGCFDASRSNLNPLTRYALAGLRHCWDDRYGRWSYKYHLDGRSEPNEFRPEFDLYYSMNVLLGLAKVVPSARPADFDVAPQILNLLCSALPRYPVRNGAWGMALWAAAELGVDVPATAADRLRVLAADPASLAPWTAQDVGLSLSGTTAQMLHDSSWTPLAQGLRDLLMSRFRGPGALFRDSGAGLRRHIATFATQVYAALSLYQFGSVANDDEALAAANRCVEKVIDLQGPNGEWPWFFAITNDSIADPYEVYSVHQHGMAPALLHEAERRGVRRARAAIEHGFAWIFGRNDLGLSMLVPSRHVIYRSHSRCGLQRLREIRLLRSAAASVRKSGWPQTPPLLQLTREMRSYEFGWLLWSFAARTDYPELTNHHEFIAAL
jgi:hypothetical protein